MSPTGTKDYWQFGEAVYPARERTAAYLAPLARLFSPGRTVADLGCGRGEMLGLLKAQGHQPIGVDTSGQSESWAAEAGIPFHRLDVFAFLQEPPSRFDGLFSYGLLEHFEPAALSRLFTLIGRACPVGAEVLMATHDPRSIQAHLSPLYGDPSHVRLYSRETVEAELRSNGFRVKETGNVPQAEQLVPSAVDPENNHKMAALMGEALKNRALNIPERQALEYARFACVRLGIVESILGEVARVLNRPMDYYVLAVKEAA